MTQLSLLGAAERHEKPRKAVRKVSRQQYVELRDRGTLSARTHAVLTALAHHYYVTQTWPTPAELCRWMFRYGRIPRESVNIVAPRVSDLVNGVWVTAVDETGKKTRIQKGGGVCELLPKRLDAVTGGQAHPVRIVEAGAVLQQFGYGGKT